MRHNASYLATPTSLVLHAALVPIFYYGMRGVDKVIGRRETAQKERHEAEIEAMLDDPSDPLPPLLSASPLPSVYEEQRQGWSPVTKALVAAGTLLTGVGIAAAYHFLK